MRSNINRCVSLLRNASVACLTLLVAAGCGGADDTASNEGDFGGESASPGEPNWPGNDTVKDFTGPTLSTLSPEELSKIKILRKAIDKGLLLGRASLMDELNVVLGDAELTDRYESSVMSGIEYVQPKRAACPFLEATTPDASLDCRALITRATASAYTHLTATKSGNPLTDVDYQVFPEESEFWFEEGISTGIDNEGVLALSDLRERELCDKAPEPTQSAYESGVAEGRKLYISQLNTRLTELGYDMQYPDTIEQIERCQADRSMLEPARSRAMTEVTAHTEQNPLCEDYNPTTPEGISQLVDANNQYADGVQRGIDTEHSLAGERIFRIVQCNVGDPLVLDIDNDGVSLQPLATSNARFDLFGSGRPLQVSWVKDDDALLVLDRNGNGTIDNGRELFANYIGDKGFDELPTGFDHLAAYDQPEQGGNGDGVINGQDAVYERLMLWQDRNSDGVSADSELHSLPELGVAAIQLSYVATNAKGALSHRANFLRTDDAAKATGEAIGSVYDAWFTHGRTRLW